MAIDYFNPKLVVQKTIDYSDPKLLAQIALTQMVQSSKGGITIAKSAFIPSNSNSALKAVDILNEAFGSVSNSCFTLDQTDGAFIYKGQISLHIPELLRRVKNEGNIYEKSTGNPVTFKDFKDIIKQIELTDLAKICNDNSDNDNIIDMNNKRTG